MTTPARTTMPAAVLMVMSSLALLAAGAALGLYFLTADGSTGELVVLLVGGATLLVAGITGVWVHRGLVIVAVFATIGFLAEGAILVLGAAISLEVAASGGSADIGGSLLLLVGAASLLPATALSLVLTFFVVRDVARGRTVGA